MGKGEGFAGAFKAQLRQVVEEIVDEAVERKLKGVDKQIINSVDERLDRKLDQALGGVTVQLSRRIAPPAGKSTKRKYTMSDIKESAQEKAQKTCNVVGCNRKHRAKGYCQGHYQSAGKYAWPMPAPENFSPPPRKRGRPASVEQQIAGKHV